MTGSNDRTHNEQFSIDEAFLDVPACRLQVTINAELKLSFTAGAE